jgi:hypothetical protein
MTVRQYASVSYTDGGVPEILDLAERLVDLDLVGGGRAVQAVLDAQVPARKEEKEREFYILCAVYCVLCAACYEVCGVVRAACCGVDSV